MDIGSFGYIDFSSDRAVLFLIQLFRSLSHSLFVDVENGDPRSFLIQGPGDRKPHPTSAARHNGILIVEALTHIFLLLNDLWPVSAPKPRLAGGVPAYRQAGRGTIRMKFPLLAPGSPLRAREAPPLLAGSFIFFSPSSKERLLSRDR